MYYELLFQRLKDLREDNDLTQEEMANVLGVSQPNYARWEVKIKIIPSMEKCFLDEQIEDKPELSGISMLKNERLYFQLAYTWRDDGAHMYRRHFKMEIALTLQNIHSSIFRKKYDENKKIASSPAVQLVQQAIARSLQTVEELSVQYVNYYDLREKVRFCKRFH